MPGWTWGDYLHYAIDFILFLIIFLLLGAHAKCETFDQRFPQVFHKVSPRVQTVRASYYGKGFAGRRTSCGQRFDPQGLTMASRSLGCGSTVRLTLGRNSVLVQVTDYGPDKRTRRTADISLGAAKKLGMVRRGVANLEMEVIR